MTIETQMAQSAIDFHGLNQLKEKAYKTEGNDPETLRKAAAQFESLFVMMMLKSMRDAKLADGMFDSNQSKMYQDMADQQLASDLSMQGGLGLQDMIIRQLGGEVQGHEQTVRAGQAYSIDTVTVRPELGIKVNKQIIEKIEARRSEMSASEPIDQAVTTLPAAPQTFSSPEQFIAHLWPMAQQAAEKIGVSPDVILSQAALETGWGKYILKDAQGQSSFNLFNIKAHGGWAGKQTEVTTREYYQGKPVNEVAQFRQYDSYQQSFDDYVNFLQTQPRYKEALANSADAETFIEKLHQAGYATDPQYANKIKRIMKGDVLAQVSLQGHRYE